MMSAIGDFQLSERADNMLCQSANEGTATVTAKAATCPRSLRWSTPLRSACEPRQEQQRRRWQCLSRRQHQAQRPFAAVLDEQRHTTHAAGSRAVVPQQKAAARINEASDYPALGICHQNQRVILLVAAEHYGACNLWVFPIIGKMRSAEPNPLSSETSAQSLPIVSIGRLGL